MSIAIQNRTISSVLVVDDDPYAREGFGYPIEELGLEPILEKGPINNIRNFLADLPAKADVVLCDYHLKKRDYAMYNGDVLLAECYKASIPGLLCTTYTDIDVTLNRDCLRYIPSLLLTTSPEPQMILSSLDHCIQEIDGTFQPCRKPWRTLVRVDEFIRGDNTEDLVGYCYVFVPAWNPQKRIRLYINNFPPEIKPLLEPGKRLHAHVNLGADTYEELYFVNWECE